jgi:hypothetical protein
MRRRIFVVFLGFVVALTPVGWTEVSARSGFYNYTGGVVRRQVGRTQTTQSLLFTTNAWINVPGAVLSHTVQSLTFDLFKVSFSAECTREPVGATRIRVIDTVQGTVVPLEPYDGGQVFCQAAPASTYSGTWLRRVGAGTHTLQVQIFSTAGLTLIDDWTFDLVVYD